LSLTSIESELSRKLNFWQL